MAIYVGGLRTSTSSKKIIAYSRESVLWHGHQKVHLSKYIHIHYNSINIMINYYGVVNFSKLNVHFSQSEKIWGFGVVKSDILSFHFLSYSGKCLLENVEAYFPSFSYWLIDFWNTLKRLFEGKREVEQKMTLRGLFGYSLFIYSDSSGKFFFEYKNKVLPVSLSCPFKSDGGYLVKDCCKGIF